MQAVRAAQGKRVERMSKDAPAGAPAPPMPTDRPPPREQMVSQGMALGMSRAVAEQQYDRQLAAWEATRGTN
jgi:hypothetical protein